MTRQANEQMPEHSPNMESAAGPGREYPGTPRWVKIFGIVLIVLVLLVVIMIFTLGHTPPVQHGP